MGKAASHVGRWRLHLAQKCSCDQGSKKKYYIELEDEKSRSQKSWNFKVSLINHIILSICTSKIIKNCWRSDLILNSSLDTATKLLRQSYSIPRILKWAQNSRMQIIRIVRIGKISDQNRIGYSLTRIVNSFEKKTLKYIS